MPSQSSDASFSQKMRERTRQAGNCVCVGLDPRLDRIPGRGDACEKIEKFYLKMMQLWQKRNFYPAAIKPNLAYFEAIGPEALKTARNLMHFASEMGMMVVLDAKRGDIGSTSTAYAQMAFETFSADAVTVSPYMGHDSVSPFLRHSKSKGVYLLIRTSNPGAADFQSLLTQEKNSGESQSEPLFIKVAKTSLGWNQGNLGWVVGATAPKELSQLLELAGDNHDSPVLLIPGISVQGVAGGQSGSAGEVAKILADSPSGPLGHLVNSSTGINFAFEKHPGMNPEEASFLELEKLCNQLRV